MFCGGGVRWGAGCCVFGGWVGRSRQVMKWGGVEEGHEI